MAKSVAAAYSALQARLAAIEGIKSAPEFPIEKPDSFPFLEMGLLGGKWENLTAVGQPNGEHSFKWQIHVSRAQGLPKALEQLLPFAERVASTLMYDGYKLGGTVDSIVKLSYTQGPSKIADVNTVCFDFELIVKILGLG